MGDSKLNELVADVWDDFATEHDRLLDAREAAIRLADQRRESKVALAWLIYQTGLLEATKRREQETRTLVEYFDAT